MSDPRAAGGTSHEADPAIDRVGPTRRPARRADGYQRWRDLLFLHWEVPVEEVRRLVPTDLELDLWEGRALVGLVPFRMEGVRPTRWCPEALAFAFPETNVRVYVHHRGRPGVFFLSLEAASWLAVKAARLGWGLPYHHARMRCVRDGDRIEYASTRRAGGAGVAGAWRIGAPLPPSRPGSLEFFLLERYLLFVERGGVVREGQVYHAPYPARAVGELEVREDLIAAAGLTRPDAPPFHACFSDGVDVELFGLEVRGG